MKTFNRALFLFILFTIMTGIIYPFLITGLCQLIFPQKANGSLIVSGGKIVGSDLIGQVFTDPKYFNGRPSAIEKPYDASNSGASNYGPSNAKFLEEVEKRIDKVRRENGLGTGQSVPADLVLSSGSGLDPHISLEAALLQVRRVADARKLPEAQVRDTVEKLGKAPFLRLTGATRVNQLRLNLAVDALVPVNR
jgi:potassium-transporting ATPase KdpC subunit